MPWDVGAPEAVRARFTSDKVQARSPRPSDRSVAVFPSRVLTPRPPAVCSSARSAPRSVAGSVVSSLLAATAVAVASAASAGRLSAQTDYYNTDLGRPLQIEDYLALERYGLELQAAPLRVERGGGGVYQWGIEPELAYGIFPRTQVEVGLPLSYVDAGPLGRRTGLAGVDVQLLHQLNAETALPGLAVAANVLLPAGGLGPDRAYPSFKAIATRTASWARVHANAEVTVGPRLAADPGDAAATPGSGQVGAGAVELARWTAGVAVDRTLPLRSLLMGAEVYARQPLQLGEGVEWASTVGVRYQYSPRLALDGGVGRRLSGENRGWYATVGSAYAFGLPFLIPRRAGGTR